MRPKLKRIVSAPTFADKKKTRTAGLLNALLLTALILAIVAMASSLVTEMTPVSALIVGGSMVLLELGLLYLVRRGHVYVASLLFPTALWLVITLTTLAYGGVSAPVFSTYLLIVIIASLLLGGSAGLGFAALSILAGLGMLYIEARGALLPPPSAFSPASTLTLEITLFSAAAALLYVAMRDLNAALERSRRAEAALRDSEAKYRNLFEHSLSGFALHEIVTDGDGRPIDYVFLEVNRAFEELTGLDADDVVGRRVADVLPGIESDPFIEIYGRVALTGEPARFEQFSTPLDRHYDVAAFSPQRGQFATIFTDITERKQAEAALRQREERFRALIENAPDGVALLGADGKLQYLGPSTKRILGYDPADEAGHDPAELTHPEDLPALLALLQDLQQEPGKVVTTQYRFRHADGAWRWLESTISNLITEPSVNAIVFNYRDITERKQAQQQAQRLANKLKAIARPARQMSSLLDLDQLVQQVVRSLQEITGCYNANFFLREDDVLVLAAGRGGYANGRPPLGYRLPLGNGIIGRVAQTGQPALVPDVDDDSHYVAWGGLPHTRSELAVPVQSGNRLLGVMDMQATEPEAFDVTDLEALGVLADQLAVALENARLYEDAQRRLSHVQALREIDRVITASLDIRLTLNVCLEQVTTQLGVDAATVLLLDSTTQTLTYAAGRGFRATDPQHPPLRLGEEHAGRAALERHLVHIPDLAETKNDLRRSTLVTDEQFTTYYGAPLVVKGQVKGVLEVFHREPLEPDPEWVDFLETLARQVAIAIDNAELFDDLQQSNIDLALAYDDTIEGWAKALELRDIETEGHSRRVAEITLRLARKMGLREERLTHIRRGALLHDIGKMGVPDRILFKPGELTKEEWDIMQQHPVHAYDLLAPIDHLTPALDIPYCHHEKWDGSGYPRGLEGEQIPLAARIFAVVDVHDALTSDRPYRGAWSEEKALEYVREEAGQHFDPEVVEAFMRVMDKN